MSLKSIYLKNFRIIGEEGAVVSFSPVTIFTGCNSAGKSTVAKALVLLDSYLSAIRANDFNLIDTSLDFSKVGKLGTFDSVLNVKSKENGVEEIVLGYEWESPVFVENTQAYFTFIKKEDDQLCNGWLKELSIAIDSPEFKLFSIKIHNGKYKIEIPNSERFLRYYQWYRIKQVAADWRNFQEQELAKKTYGNSDKGEYHGNTEAYSVVMDGLLRYEKDIVDAGMLRKELWENDFNKEMVEKISPEGITALISESFWDKAARVHQLQEWMNAWINISGNNMISGKNVIVGSNDCYLDCNTPCLFVKAMVNEALKPEFTERIGYVDSSTVEVKRIYPLDGTNRFGNLCREYNTLKVSGGHKFNRKCNYMPGTFINKWLKEFGICDSLKIENEEGQLRIKLVTKESPDGRMLADYGYGVTQLVSLLLNIEIAISRVEQYPIRFMGQSSESDDCMSIKPFWLIIEEPEVHLHPLLQSRLADMFLDASSHDVKLIVETHSEYCVRRSQVLVAESGFDRLTLKRNNPFRVYYFPIEGLPYDMKYQTNGYFVEPFGEGFFDEAVKWSCQLNNIKNR